MEEEDVVKLLKRKREELKGEYIKEEANEYWKEDES